MKSWLFPGQGSQQKGMGKTLFSEFPDLVSQADEILGYSIQELCLENPEKKLNQTAYTQPAIYIINALSYLHKTAQGESLPDFVAGHSLGEYNALLVAGAFDFITGLRLVKKRGELFSQAADGAMAAVINLSGDELQGFLTENGLDAVDIANFNAPQQIVISGKKPDIAQAIKLLDHITHVHCTLLPTSGAFHSRYMRDAQQAFAAFLDTIPFNTLNMPVIANVTAQPYLQSDIATTLVSQITHQVNWNESIHYLMQQGDMQFEELGPGNVLTKLLSKIQAAYGPSLAATKPVEPFNKTTILSAESLGSQAFRQDYGIKYAYVTGGMVKGIASAELVIQLGKAGLMGYFGTGGLTLAEIETALQQIQATLGEDSAYGMNFLHEPHNPQREADIVELFFQYNVKCIEIAAFIELTPALVKYRLKGVRRDADGKVIAPNKILAKLSRIEFVDIFLSPPPKKLVDKLLATEQISVTEAALAQYIPMVDDVCVEADSAGQTDMGMLTILLPAIIRQRDHLMTQHGYSKPVRVGAAGGIGNPEAAGAAFLMGAEFILTGSINQCTVEAGTSEAVKNTLQQLGITDTTYVPAGDMFEFGTRSQVVRQGVSFPVRANKLYDVYLHHESLDDIDERTKKQIQDIYFQRSFEDIYTEAKTYYAESMPELLKKAERIPKFKMAIIFKWYFARGLRLAIQGNAQYKMDYQIYCGPAMGAFNQWVKGTALENWRQRHVNVIAEKLMQDTATLLMQRYAAMHNSD